MQSKFLNELGLLAKILGAIVATITGLWFLFSASVDRYINERIADYTESAAYKIAHEQLVEEYLRSADFDQFYAEMVAEKFKNRVGLRELLSVKMGVDTDEVAIELGKMYRTEGELRTNVLELSRRIREIEQQ